jgi:shikimate dehydrogenase
VTDRYVVVGNPVAHSLSPRIHAAFAEATGEDLSYQTLLAPRDGFAAAVEAFFAAGGAGVNVTVPFKEPAADWVTELDPAARAAGAVNTITRAGGGFRGYNTDGAGLIRDLTGHCRVMLAEARVLLLGAGGAARGVARPLLAENLRCLVIANRTAARAISLADTLQAEHPRAEVRGTALGRVTPGFDVIINATSAGLGPAGGVAPVDPAVARDAFCYDMIYSAPSDDGTTAFCRWAAAHRARQVADGLGMLVEQAALAFQLWRGMLPATAPVLELLRRRDV